MSLGSRLSVSQMSELAGVSIEQLETWIEEGLVPTLPSGAPEGFPQLPRIDINQVLGIRVLRDGGTPEEARAAVLKNGRTKPGDFHRPPSQDEQEKLRDAIHRDRRRMGQELRRGPK